MAENSAEFVIRKYLPNDLVGVKSLVKQLNEMYGELFDDYSFTDYMQVRLLETTMGTFVAEIDGEIKGVCFTEIDRDTRGFLHGRVTNLIVDTDCQGKGIGSALLQECFNYLSYFSVPSVWANVNPQNEIMIHMFEKQGFKNKFKMMEKTNMLSDQMVSFAFNQGSVNYRSIVESDLTVVRNLIQELAKIFDVDFDEFWFNLNAPNFFRDPPTRIFVAETDEMIVGTDFAEVRRDPMGYLYGYISNIIIHESARGQGIGTNLLQIASAFLFNLNMRKIWANMNFDNDVMQHIYEKQGFQYKFAVMEKQLNVNLFGSQI
jgi:ribosomal protein S18 acetylase RimI-like enzyme